MTEPRDPAPSGQPAGSFGYCAICLLCRECGGTGSRPDMTCCLVCGGGGKVYGKTESGAVSQQQRDVAARRRSVAEAGDAETRHVAKEWGTGETPAPIRCECGHRVYEDHQVLKNGGRGRCLNCACALAKPAPKSAGETPEASEKRAFMAGWRHGYYDHGEHDCRMFTPTAERAWEDYQLEQKVPK